MSEDFDNNDNFNNDDFEKIKPMGFFKTKKVGKYDKSIEYDSIKVENGKKDLLFWIPFVILLFISIVFFLGASNTVVGWFLLLILFIVLFFSKAKILSFKLIINIIFWIVMLFFIFLIFSFTLPSNKDDGNKKNLSSEKVVNVNYSKSYDFPGNIGDYKISVNNKGNDYILKIDVKVSKDILPEGFKWDPLSVKEMSEMNSAALDNLFVCWKSVDEQPKYDRLGSLGPMETFENNKYILKDYNETSFIKHGKSIDDLKKYMQQGDKLELLWFNTNEAGYIDVKEIKDPSGFTYKTGTLNAEKGYGLHPNLYETEIPWDSMLEEIGIK